MNYRRLADEIAAWMRSYAEQAAMCGYVIGLSGGIDSAVTAALAIRAVGAEHTLGAIMPCHSQAEDAHLAHNVADALGLNTETVDLTSVYDALAGMLPVGPKMACANIKARLRMTTLYYLAQCRDYLVAGTGNKPEMLVGYFTKYGDGGVDIEPLGDLYKGEVRKIAAVLSIPERIIARPPSAGLWPGQTDEGELGISYEELDAVLEALATNAAAPVPLETVDRVHRMVAASAHKRAMPPIFKVQYRP